MMPPTRVYEYFGDVLAPYGSWERNCIEDGNQGGGRPPLSGPFPALHKHAPMVVLRSYAMLTTLVVQAKALFETAPTYLNISP